MRAIIFLSAGSLALATAAHADFVDVQFLGTGSGQQLKIYSPEHNGSVFVGQLMHRLSNGPTAYNGDWVTFCTDLGQFVSDNTNQFSIVDASMLPDGDPMGVAKAQAIRDMYAYAAGAQLLGDTSNDMASAFQLAIWEVITDYSNGGLNYGLDITAGNFTATMNNDAALSAGISGHLSSFLGAVGTNGSAELAGLRSGSKQDQILQIIPGPGVFAIASIAAVFGRGRRRAN